MKIAIMQPYFLPYIGYFQLINAVETFIFYDDVNFINKGWINRNNFLINGQKQLITMPCKGASQNKLINEIELSLPDRFVLKTLKGVMYSYKKAPYYNDVFTLFEEVLRYKNLNLARFAANSIIEVCKYIGFEREFKFSSEAHSNTIGMEKADRLIQISKNENAKEYINVPGGQKIYDKKYFLEKGIELHFLKTKNIYYSQYREGFIQWLSIIDILMFNSKDETKELLSMYTIL